MERNLKPAPKACFQSAFSKHFSLEVYQWWIYLNLGVLNIVFLISYCISDIAMVKLKVLRNEEEGHCVTLEMLDEDHTLGNSLRYIIMKNQCVKFCGYSIPHPTERRVIMQIQTYPSKGVTGLQVFEQGLQDLLSICQVVKHKFSNALNEHSELES